MITSPAPRAGPTVDRWLGPALQTAGTAARAEPAEAGAAPRWDDRRAHPGNAAVVDLQRQVNEPRSDLLDVCERGIERRQEANGLVLVFLDIAIGIGGLWTYAKFRSVADRASIGAAAGCRERYRGIN